MDVDWKPHARRLAESVTDPVSRWREPVTAIPRHLFVPRWWHWRDPGGWTPGDGPADEAAWMATAYRDDVSVTTRNGALHADHAQAGDQPSGRPTSSATMPRLVLRMLRHLRVYEGADILDVGTGSGYSTAVLARRLGEDRVTSIDVDPYLTAAAGERLNATGLHPQVVTCDATGPLPGTYDRIVSMVSVRPLPASWLAALRPGGRLVTTITGMTVIITAVKDTGGGATGQVEWDRAGFMTTRTGDDYPPGPPQEVPAALRDREGEQVSRGRYPVLNLGGAWELKSVLAIRSPGIEDWYEYTADGQQTAWLLHPDRSWARATAMKADAPVVHQGGPRRLWDILDDLRGYWLERGYFQLYGANVSITPDGTIHLASGHWRATIT